MMTTDPAGRNKKPKRKVLLVVFVGLFALVVVVVCTGLFVLIKSNQLANGRPKADESLKTLEKEFTLIAPFPDTYRLRYEASHKISLGSVGADYRTDKGYAEIRAHYDDELKKNGWTFVDEKPIKIWWQDYGGKEAFYCKGRYTATLQYAGRSEEEFGWTYNFTLSWGLGYECR